LLIELGVAVDDDVSVLVHIVDSELIIFYIMQAVSSLGFVSLTRWIFSVFIVTCLLSFSAS